jgi:hypothetical protein
VGTSNLAVSKVVNAKLIIKGKIKSNVLMYRYVLNALAGTLYFHLC